MTRPSTPTPPRPSVGRIVVVFAVSLVALLAMSWLLADLSIDGWSAAVGAVVVIAVVNGTVWPFIARFATRLIVWTLGLLGLVANGVILLIGAQLVDGFEVDGLGTAVIASLGMTAVAAATGNLLAIDDDVVWRRNVVRRMVDRLEPPEPTEIPGVLFLQIDGLSEAVFRRALGEGFMPTVARWVRSGTHQIIGWECDLSSQTGASQAGILHGDNSDMPAFRWYDKEAGRVMTSNRPRDAAEIERRQSDGNGLLADGGVSRSNVFSGDSPDSLLTFSTVTDRSRSSKHALSYFLADPNAIARLLVLSGAEVARELAAAWRSRRRDIQPRQKRSGVYPLVRAGATVMLRDLTVYTLLSDIYRGVPAAYADLVGYDEVAHHSGISAPDALETLWRLDQQFARLERAMAEAPRPYHVVVLSDHGQTQGSTFLQRYNLTLADLVDSLLDRSQQVDGPEQSSEGWGNLNALLSDTIQDDSRVGHLVASLVRRRTVDGEVVLGPGYASAADRREAHDAVVLASGNLGLISFPGIEGRASFEALTGRYPGLVLGLATHPGIGLVLVRSEVLGPLVIGNHGVHYLDDGRVEGIDPLAPFGPNAADHLRRTDSFHNCPDLLVNSFYDPEMDEGAAFEELIGFHGGLGGKQTEPFVLFPSGLPVDPDPLVGAESVHTLFKGWLTAARAGALPAPWGIAERSDAPPPLPPVSPDSDR
ncbi:MAG: phage holin family protein [Actinomycetia bacterium]|nr:phage holin family protein [Actinomycetes bacterium]